MPAKTPGWIRWDPIGNALADLDSEALQDVVDGLDSVVGTLNDLAELVSAVEALLAQDPISQAIGAFVQVFEALLDDLEGTDIYFLPHLPHTWADVLRPYTIRDVADDLASSIADKMDPNRPLFDAGGTFGSVTFIVGADNWMDFRKLLKLLSEMFSDAQIAKWSRFADIRFEFDKYQRYPKPRAERGSQGETWDWYRTNWPDLVPAVTDVLRACRDFAEGFTGGVSGLGRGLSEVTQILSERLAYIRAFIEEFAKLAEFLRRIAELAPQVAILPMVSADGGSNELTRAFYASLGGPAQEIGVSDSRKGGPKFQLCAGFTLLSATGNPAAYFEILKKLLGLQIPAIESALGNIQQAAEAL